MAKASIAKIQAVLTNKLRLTSPEFRLEKLADGKVSGSIVSDAFVDEDDLARQRAIWNALE